MQITGTITLIEEEKIITRKEKESFSKVVITLETTDNQIVFIEVKNSKIKELELKNIKLHDYVTVCYIFKGSIKNEKRYNNIILVSIEKSKW